MIDNTQPTPTRRALLAGAAGAGALLLLPGCVSTGGGFSLTEAVRRLLLVASENAFARLTAPGGFWDEQVARIGLAQLLGARGSTARKAASCSANWSTSLSK